MKTITLTFPNKTAQEIVEACDNKLGTGKLLYSIDWCKDEPFYTTEKCREKTVTISGDIEHFGKSYTECVALQKNGVEMLTFAEVVYFIQEYFKQTGEYPDDRWSWTNSRSSCGCLVLVGFCDSDGVDVGYDGPDYSDSDLGVRLFRSAVTDSLTSKPGQGETLKLAIETVKNAGYVIYKQL